MSGQAGLFDATAEDTPATFDAACAGLRRAWLDEGAWVDVLPGWVRGSQRLFDELLASRPWKQRRRLIHGKTVLEPRLTAPWSLASGEPLAPPLLEAMRRCLSRRYGVELDSVGFNLYRDGNDAVAWHRDAIDPAVVDPIVALVSLGDPRRLSVRPRGGGSARGFALGHGDLLVTGGTMQRTWEHAVLRTTSAGPRISLAFRTGLKSTAYQEPA